jgi:gliding motility-associated-like protein
MRNKLLILVLFFIGQPIYSQQVVNHQVPFNTTNQNMWGPNWSPFSIDQEITLFNVPWNTSFNTGNAMIGQVAGFSFGAALQGSISGVIGSKISLLGFTTGTLDVDYPIDAAITTPTDNTYDQGDTVTVATSYTLDPAAEITSYYPSAGEAKWDVYFQLGASASATVCVFSCATFPIIPAFNTGLVNINLVTVNANGVSMLSGLGIGPLFTQAFLPYPLPDALGDYGLSGEITIPYVSTESSINGLQLDACGDSTYFNLNLNVFDLIGAMNIPYVSAIMENLAGSEDFGIASVTWNFFDASFDANITNNQCFNFDPTVYVSFAFPVPVSYRILNPSNNTAGPWATSSIINFPVGMSLQYKFPCYFETIHITPTYTINGTVTNHTYDVVSFDFLMSALQFGFSIPAVQITPAIYVPSICIPIYYPCGAYWFGINWCSTQACTPAFTIPAIGWAGYTFNVGPVWSTSIPIGSFSYDWFNQTWSLAGFQAYSFSPFSMTADVLSASATATPVSCFGGNNGAVSLAFNNVAYPLSYLWTNGATTPTLSNVSANSYQAQIIDANGCQLLTGGIVIQPAYPLQANVQATNVSCFSGVSNGAINATVSGGTSPYTYSWNNGALTEDLANIGTGNYTITVTDANNCTASNSATITAPSDLVQSASIINVPCVGGTSGAINVTTTGGVSPYSYSWSNGQSTEDIQGLSAGSYTLTITDTNNCTDIQTHVVTEPNTSINLSSNVTNVACYGGTTGLIDITTTGGTPGYTFQWSATNGIVIPQTTEDISNLSAGNYTLTATDANGCPSSLNVTISQPAQALQSSPQLSHVTCFNGTNGTVQPLITGGTAPYIYAWSNATSANVLPNVAAGPYTLNLTDANNCTATFNYTLLQPNAALAIALNGSNVLCFGDASGAANAVISGGTSPYTLAWSNGSSNASIQNILAGTYNITVTDQQGCLANQSITITEPAAPLNVSTLATMVDCFGNQSGSINATITGGTAPYSSSWINQNSQIYASSAEDLTLVGIGNYLTIVTDSHGCIDSSAASITQPAALSISNSKIDVLCHGNNTGSINATVAGGTLPYSYVWNNGALTEDINAIPSGSYTLTVLDVNGCTETMMVAVIQPIAPLSVSTETSSIDCFGLSTGAVSATVVGGTAPYQYTWSNGGTSTSISDVLAGAYSITVTDNHGCTAFSGANVLQPQQGLNVAVNVTDPSCHGYANGIVEMTITGGTQPYYFNWGNENNILLNNPSERLDSIAVGSYLFVITDDRGCVVDTIVQVNEPTPFNIAIQTTDALCYQSATGMVDLSVTGSTPPYQFNWNDGQFLTEDLSNVLAGSYAVQITDNQGCIDSIAGVVNQPDSLFIDAAITNVSCVDQADGAVALTVLGGISPYSFAWSNGENVPTISNLSAGIYVATITDDNSCIATITVEVLPSNIPCVNPVNTFTPNGDLFNDTWVIDNMYLYPNASVQVFNKWGNLVFKSEGLYTPWDGTYNNNPLPAEVYYYIIELNDTATSKLTGTLTIIR